MAKFLDPRGSEGLYGPHRDSARTNVKDLHSLRNVLCEGEWTDGNERKLFPWSTTTSASFKAPQIATLKTERIDTKQKDKSLKTNFILGSESNAKFATTAKDFDNRLIGDTDKDCQDYWNTSIPDFAPKYMADTRFGKDGFSHTANWIGDSQIEKVAQIRSDRKQLTRDLRSTHFLLGSDPDSFKSETGHCFANEIPTSDGPTNTAALTARETHKSRVFRQGDWNEEQRDFTPNSVTRSDFHHAPLAAGISSRNTLPFDHVQSRKSHLEVGSRTSNLRRQIQQALLSKFSSQRDPSSANIREAFAHYDKQRSGFIAREDLKAVLKEFQTVDDEELDALLAECQPAQKDGKLNYLEFGKFLITRPDYQSLENEFTSLQQESFVDHGVTRTKNKLGRAEDDPSHPYYHRSTHFSLGTNKEEPRTLYFKDFMQGKRKCLSKPIPAPPPMPSQVLPQMDCHSEIKSTKQADYVDHTSHSKSTLSARVSEQKKNQGRHSTVVVDISCDPRDTEGQRIASMTGADFIRPPKEYPWLKPNRAPISKYRYLDTNGALKHPPKDPYCSEAKENYVMHSELTGDLAGATKKAKQTECRERITDTRCTHFLLGSESGSPLSEQHHQFRSKIPLDPRIRAAGKTEALEQIFSSINHSEVSAEETQPKTKLKTETDIVGATAQMRNLQMERFFNPKDPVNINMRKAFLEYDTSLSGTISPKDLNSACEKLHLNISSEKFQQLLNSCGKGKDGMINYHDFIRVVSQDSALKNGIPPSKASVMKEDYNPPEQRKFTVAQQLGIEIARRLPFNQTVDSHFFHLDSSHSPRFSTTNNDYIRPDVAPGTSRLAAPAGR